MRANFNFVDAFRVFAFLILRSVVKFLPIWLIQHPSVKLVLKTFFTDHELIDNLVSKVETVKNMPSYPFSIRGLPATVFSTNKIISAIRYGTRRGISASTSYEKAYCWSDYKPQKTYSWRNSVETFEWRMETAQFANSDSKFIFVAMSMKSTKSIWQSKILRR